MHAIKQRRDSRVEMWQGESSTDYAMIGLQGSQSFVQSSGTKAT